MTQNRRTFLRQVGYGTAGLGLISFLPGCESPRTSTAVFPPSIGPDLPRSTPEAQGVSSSGLLEFLDALQSSKHEFHSFMLVRHGNVVAEGWWDPYGPDINHTMYSMSKSFTSTGVGFAVAEKKLTVEDRVLSFFPEDAPANPGENLSALRIKDLLTMSVGHERDSLFPMMATDNWVRGFLALPIVNKPGTAFLYNSGATYMLSAIVQKVTGQKLIDYLRPRLFEPLAIEGMTWETCPRGINTGGWGLNIRTEGLAKFGQLYLQKGQWKGRTILPAAWVEEATTKKIQQPLPPQPARPNEQNDWLQGYAYQFWRCQREAFRGDGAFGQFTVVMPTQDAVVAITSESPDMQGELDLLWKHLWPALVDKPLPADDAAAAEVRKRMNSLSLKAPEGSRRPPAQGAAQGKIFKLEPNPLGLETAQLDFQDSECLVRIRDARQEHRIRCGLGKWEKGETALPGTPPRLVPNAAVSLRSKVAAAGAWKDDVTFEMLWRYYETPHHDTVTVRFDGSELKLSFLGSIAARSGSRQDARPMIKGVAS